MCVMLLAVLSGDEELEELDRELSKPRPIIMTNNQTGTPVIDLEEEGEATNLSLPSKKSRPVAALRSQSVHSAASSSSSIRRRRRLVGRKFTEEKFTCYAGLP